MQGDWIFVSGTTGFDYVAMTIADGVDSQADVVRVHCILPDGDDFARCWPVLRSYFGDVRPAAAMSCAKLFDPRMLIEIEVTALRRGA